MKKTHRFLFILFALPAIVACSDQHAPAANTDTVAETKPAVTTPDPERGKYLVTVLGCGDCHSPKKFGPQGPYEDPDLLLSGHPAKMQLKEYDKKTAANWVLFNEMNTATVGPWGVSYAANISSDATGIGNWSEEQFIKALREGKAKGLDGSRMLLPPMPWPSYSKLTDDDIRSIFAYLKTTKPVENIVPPPVAPAGK